MWHIICDTTYVARWMWHIVCGTLDVAHHISFVPATAHTCHKTDSITVDKANKRHFELHCLWVPEWSNSCLLCCCINRNYFKNMKLIGKGFLVTTSMTCKVISPKLRTAALSRTDVTTHSLNISHVRTLPVTTGHNSISSHSPPTPIIWSQQN